MALPILRASVMSTFRTCAVNFASDLLGKVVNFISTRRFIDASVSLDELVNYNVRNMNDELANGNTRLMTFILTEEDMNASKLVAMGADEFIVTRTGRSAEGICHDLYGMSVKERYAQKN